MIYRGRILESRALTPSTHMIRVEKPAEFSFRPVQFCGLEIPTSQGSEEYPMSLACSPTKPYLEFGARLSDSPWKRGFAALRPGDEVEVDGAYGHFVLDESRDAVFVAGGIGITPLKGMAEYRTDTQSPRRTILLYSSRDQGEIAYRDDLDALAEQNPRFSVLHTLTREPESSGWTGHRGRIDGTMLRESAALSSEPIYYLCGRGDMVMETGRRLREMGVAPDHITYEVFRGYG